MQKNILDSVSPDKILDYKVIKKDLENVIEAYINKIEREFPFKNIKHGRELFAGFVKVAKNTYKSIVFLEQTPTWSVLVNFAAVSCVISA